jgi:hypothetical protein
MKGNKSRLFLASFLFLAVQVSAQVKQVYASVVQGKKSFELNQEIHLKRDDFKFVFSMAEPSSLLISCATEDVTLREAQKGVKMNKLKGFQGTGMAEGLFNPDKEILFDNESASCWYYDSLTSHRFSDAYWDNGGIKCERKIKQLYDVTNQKSVPLKQAPTLYLVFIEYKWNSLTNEHIEVARDWLIINWD